MSSYKYTRDQAYQMYREDPGSFFNDVIHSDAENETQLINQCWPLFWSKYHYNLVENGIMEIIMKYNLSATGSAILDIGSGTGHWIDFYRSYFDPSCIWSIDFASGPLEKLKQKYENVVSFLHWDISAAIPDIISAERFDIINAIGIIFHIVDDIKWEKAIENLSALLSDKGVLIIGGDFGPTTLERGIMRKTHSLDEWEKLVQTLGLKIIEVKRHDWWAGADNDGITDNLLAIKAR